jgi:hypothetical protein
MQQLFNINRFRLLFIKHTAEHYKSYLMSLSLLWGVLTLGGTFLFLIPVSLDPGFQGALFSMVMLLAGTVFASTIFADIGDRKKAIQALTLPASHLEKYLVAWIYSYVIFLLVYTGSFYVVLSCLMYLKPHASGHVGIFNLFDSDIGLIIFLIFSLLQAIALYGAIFFEKLHYIKTAFVFFVGIMLVMVLNTLFLYFVTGRPVRPSSPFGNLRFTERGREVIIDLNLPPTNYVLYMLVLMILIIWTAAYYRLKEKQV